MLKTNIGSVDRALRVAIGAALFLAFALSSRQGWEWLYLIGIVPLATGLVGSCPLYSLLGISTCRLRS